jgi:hypothetical protein
MDMNSVQIRTKITASLGAGHMLNLFPRFCKNLRWDYVKASLSICLTLAVLWYLHAGTLLFGFAEENGGRSFIGGKVKAGQTVIIPQGNWELIKLQ